MKPALFLDFDGVVLDSVNVKTDAFYEMYLPYGKDIAEQVKKYHMDHGGISRFEKFRYYEGTILNRNAGEEEIQKLGDRFSELVFEKVLKCAFIDGFMEFIEKYYRIFDCFVVSGTPEDELKIIVEKRKLQPFFKGIFGSPTKKIAILESLLGQFKYDARQCYYFGDASTDLEAANAHNIPFILIKSPDNSYLISKSDKAIDSFAEMELQAKT